MNELRVFPGRFSSSMTVLEMVMTMVIIAILGVLAVPRVEVANDIKFQGAVKTLRSDIRYAQSLAVYERRDVEISFSPSADTYKVVYVDTGSGVKDAFTRADVIRDFEEDPYFAGVDVVSADFAGRSVLRFDWQGMPMDWRNRELDSAGEVVLAYRGKKTRITITPQTGKVSLE